MISENLARRTDTPSGCLLLGGQAPTSLIGNRTVVPNTNNNAKNKEICRRITISFFMSQKNPGQALPIRGSLSLAPFSASEL